MSEENLMSRIMYNEDEVFSIKVLDSALLNSIPHELTLERTIEALTKLLKATKSVYEGDARISKELSDMVKKELKSNEEEYNHLCAYQDKIKERIKQTKFIEAMRTSDLHGVSLNLLSVTRSTDFAFLLNVEELGEIWIPKTMCEINGNLLFIYNWWFEEKKNYKGGKKMFIQEWKKLIPEHYDTDN